MKSSGARKNLLARPSKETNLEQKGWFSDMHSALDQKGNLMRKARVFSRLKSSRTD